MPASSVAVEIKRAVGAIASVSGTVETRFCGSNESAALTTSGNVPHAVGVPLISPLRASSIRPAGKAPDAMLHETVPTCPLDVPARLNPVPTRPSSAGAIDATNDGALIVSVAVAVAMSVGQFASTACSPIENTPAAVGVPETRPDASSVTPSGNAPSVIDHCADPVPPDAVALAAYGALKSPVSSVVVVITSEDGSTLSVSGFASTRPAVQESC